MGRRARGALGGLLVGVGQALSNRYRDRVDEEIRRRDEAFTLVRDEKLFEQEKGLLSGTEVGEGGNVYGITRGGKKLDLGFKAAGDPSKGGMSAGDKRIWDAAKDIYTTEDLTGEHTDWSKVSKHLREQGHVALAQLADPGKDTSKIDVNSDEYLEAQRMADDWIDEATTVLGRDKTELADYGGNRADARQAKTMEFYQQILTGTIQPSGGTKQPAAETKSAATGAKPTGSGTESNPYQATSQEDIDWFKANADAGEFIEIDGKLYRK